MKVVLTGANDFARKRELAGMVNSFVAEHGDLALERLEGEAVDVARLLDSVSSLPFLADRRMVVLDEPGRNKTLTESIDQILDRTADSTDLIIVEPRPDKRLTYFKTLKKLADVREFAATDARSLGSWLVAEAKSRGGVIKLGDANYLVERVGADQLLLSNELDKLLTYNSSVTRATIDLLTEPAPQSSIFELLDAAFAGNHRRALAIYDEQRVMKVEPQQIIAMMAWQLGVVAILKAAGSKSPDQVASEAKINPFVARKAKNIADKLTMGETKALVARTLDLDVRLKSEAVDADDALKHYLLSL